MNHKPGTKVFDKLSRKIVTILKTKSVQGDDRWEVYYLTDASVTRDSNDGWRRSDEISIKGLTNVPSSIQCL